MWPQRGRSYVKTRGTEARPAARITTSMPFNFSHRGSSNAKVRSAWAINNNVKYATHITAIRSQEGGIQTEKGKVLNQNTPRRQKNVSHHGRATGKVFNDS